jgi:VIT1/CCC1 family predicted Fe2+/Mn2+ transporter
LRAAGQEEIHTMLIGALGCNLAWGLIDAVMYLMACYSERGRGILALRALRLATGQDQSRSIIADNLPPLLAAAIPEQQFELIRQKLNELPEPPERPWLTKADWKGAAGVFLLVFLSTLPVVIPFLFVREATAALRASNTLAVIMLFLTGYVYGHYATGHPWRSGLLMIVVGVGLVAISVAFGG